MGATSIQVVLRNTSFSASLERLDLFYWWMAERHRIYNRRLQGLPQPWTDDRILDQQRFCNVFRVLDRITQYLIHNVIEKGDQDPREILFRIMVFRFFNRIDTWKTLEESIGEIRLSSFQREKYHAILSNAYTAGESLYGPAYIIPSPRIAPGPAFENHLHLISRLKDANAIDTILTCSGPAQAHAVFKQFPGIGDFIAYQLVLDISLVSDIQWDENSFTATGPGSREGLKLIFNASMGTRDLASEAIMYLFREQDVHWRRLGIEDVPGVSRDGQVQPPQVADIEHSLCEFAKYVSLSKCGSGRLPARRGPYVPSSEPLSHDPPKKWVPPLREPSPDSDLEEDEYEVSHIVAERRCRDGSMQYKVRWIGYEPKDDTWLDGDAFETAQGVFKGWAERPRRPGRVAKENVTYFHPWPLGYRVEKNAD